MDDLQMSGKISQYGDFRSANGREQNRTYSTAQSAFMHGFPSSFSNAKGTIDRAAKIVEQQIQDEVSFLQSDISEKDKTIEDLRQRRDNLKTGYDALRLNYDTLESRYSDLSAKFDKQKAEKEKAQVGYNQVVGALKKISRQVSDLTQQIADKDKQIEDLKNLSEETLNAKQEEIDRLKKKVRSSKKQANRKKIQDLERQIANKSQEIENLKNSGQEVLASRRKEIENLEEEVRNLNEKVQKLKEKRSMRQETDRQLKQLKSDYETLKNSHGQKEALLEKLEEERRALEAQLEEANEENERLAQELADTRQQLEQTEADLQQTSEQLQQLYNSFNNIETADRQEAIAYLKGLSKLIQDGQFPADGVNIRSTSGLWRGVLSSLADIQGEINDLELEFAKDQGPDYCVNEIINELTQPEIVDPDGSLARINMLARAYFSVPDQRPIGEAIVKAAVQRGIPNDPTYRDICQIFGQKEAQEMAVSVLNDQSIAELCQEANVCFEEPLDADSAGKLCGILTEEIPEATSKCFVEAARQKEEQLENDKEQQIVAWGRQAIECLKNGQDDEFGEIYNKISEVKEESVNLDFFINLEADEIEKQIKEFRESYCIEQPDGSVIQGEETFFDELDGAVQNIRNFEFNATFECDQARETLFKCFEPVLQVLAQRAYTAGETMVLRDARILFDSILARSESFVEKANFLEVMGNGDECQGAFDFASDILPNIDKSQVYDGKFVVPVVVPVEEEGEVVERVEEKMMSIDDVLPDHFNMFDRLQKTVGHYAFQVHDNLLSQYQGAFEEFLSSYVPKNSGPESIAGLMRLSEACENYNYELGAPAEFLDTVSSIENAAESLRKAYLLSFIINNDGSEVDGYGAPIVEVYNKIIEIADAAESPDQYESLLQQAIDGGFGFGPFSLEELEDMCLKYAMSRDFIEAYQNLDGNYTGAVNFISDEYWVSFQFNYPHRDLAGLGLNPNLIETFAGSSVSEQASQRAAQWKQGQLAQDGVSYEAYQAALAIKEAVNVTNANFWHQVGDSLIDIGREFCEVLEKGDAPEEDIESIRNYFYALIMECETNGGGVGIIPQTLPF